MREKTVSHHTGREHTVSAKRFNKIIVASFNIYTSSARDYSIMNARDRAKEMSGGATLEVVRAGFLSISHRLDLQLATSDIPLGSCEYGYA